MQTTLLGLAIAIILALVAALVAPLVVDWNDYRAAFEQEASRLTGLTVRVNGSIDARILPTPLLKLRNVEVSEPGRAPQLRVGTLELEVGLGPLLRGEVRASQLRLIAPQLALRLDRTGAIEWPVISPSFRPETLSVSRFNVEDGRVILEDAASGGRLMLHKLWFVGDIRSFVGPFQGEGAFVAGDELYGYRVSGSRADGDRGLKIRLGIDPSNRPLTTELDGALVFDHGVPQFDGTVTLTRPVGAALSSGKRVVSDPWRARGKIQATSASASVQDVEFQYGPDSRAINFSGRADLKFGEHPRLDGVVSALRLDVDRAAADPDLTHQPPLLVVKSFVESFVAAIKPPLPAQLGVAVDALTLGGTTIQALRGDIRFDETGWSVNRFEFRAPGFTQVNLSGRLQDTPQGLAFTGPATVESADANMLLAALSGHGDRPSREATPLSARGDVTVASDRLAIDGLTAALDRQKIEGRLAYSWADGDRPAMLDADLRAAELDVDAVTTFGKAAVADSGFELPHQVALDLDIGKATFAGVDARQVKAKLKIDSGVLNIDRLSVGDLGGTALDIGGRIDELSSQPRGRLTLDLDARTLAGLTNVIGKFAPQAAASFRRYADRLAPAKVHGVLTVEHASAGSAAKLDLNGQLGVMRVALKGDAKGEPSQLGAAAVRIESRLDADDGGTLMTLMGLDRFVAVDRLPGRITLSAAGPLDGDLQVDGLVAAGGIAVTARGALRLSGERPAGNLEVKTSLADLRPLHQFMTGQPGAAVPVSASAAVALAGVDLSINDLAVTVGKAVLHGRLAFNLASPLGLDGDIAADEVDAAGALAMLAGLPSAANPGGPWSSALLGTGAFGAVNGAVTFKFARADFTGALVAHDLKGVARFRPSEIALEDIDGSLAGGRFGGELSLRRTSDGVAAHGRVELSGADAAAILAPGKRALDGQLTLTLQGDSIGGSPDALVGALHGGGTVALADAHFSGIDAAAFEAAMRAADQNATIEPAKIQAAVSAAMAHGALAVPHGDAAATITGGVLNLSNVTLQAPDGAALALAGVLDLRNAAIDATLTLSQRPAANAMIRIRPELAVRLKGPLAAPERTLDVSALTGWLTMRAAELQTRRLESLEANRRPDTIGPIVRPEPPAVRSVPNGAVAESERPANMAMAPPAARAFDRLQPETPAAAPDATRLDSGGGNRAAAPAATLPPPIDIKPVPTPATPAPPRSDNATATAGTPAQAKRQPAPPQPAAPAKRSPFDFLFGSHN